MSETSQPGNNGPGQIISSVRSIRLAIFLITTSLIACCAVFNVYDFTADDVMTIPDVSTTPFAFEEDENATNYFNFTNFTPTPSSPTLDTQMTPLTYGEIPPIYLFLCGLSLSAISAFLHAGFILKLSMMLITVLVQTLVLYTSETFRNYQDEELNV